MLTCRLERSRNFGCGADIRVSHPRHLILSLTIASAVEVSTTPAAKRDRALEADGFRLVSQFRVGFRTLTVFLTRMSSSGGTTLDSMPKCYTLTPSHVTL